MRDYADETIEELYYIEDLKGLIEDIILEGNEHQIKPVYLAWYRKYHFKTNT